MAGSTSAVAETVADIRGRADPEVQEIRRTAGVGASEIAAVLGVSPWQTELGLWAVKHGDVAGWEGNESTNWGQLHEPTIIAHRATQAAAHGLRVIRPHRIYRSLRNPAMTCSPDAVEVPGTVVFDLDHPAGIATLDDAKTQDGFHEPSWDALVPNQYMLQVQYSGYVLGAPACALDVLFGGNRYRRFEFEVDEELGEMMGAAAADFMRSVEEHRPPAPQYGHSETASVLAQLHRGHSGTEVELSPPAVKALRDLLDLGERKRELEDQIETLRNVVRAEMRDADRGVCPRTGKVLVTWTAEQAEQVQVSLADLRKQHPHLYRMVERRVGKPAGRATRINLRRKALGELDL